MSDFRMPPFPSVVASITTYSTILGFSTLQDRSYSSLKTHVKLVSACHSIFALSLTVASLCQNWEVESQPKTSTFSSHNGLDDANNPLISGTNNLANFVTAWEAGYLIYDTGALFLESAAKSKTRKLHRVLLDLLRDSPASILHHVCLASALLYLQTYIARRREKGVKVIMAFFLMNASTPVLHLRWWRKKATGRNDFRLDLALAAVFAITRFGSIYWAVAKYAQHHGLGSWNALRQQRTICQTGTALLTALNALWWVALLAQMANKKNKGLK